jgi:hypothetical protein
MELDHLKLSFLFARVQHIQQCQVSILSNIIISFNIIFKFNLLFSFVTKLQQASLGVLQSQNINPINRLVIQIVYNLT